MAKHKKTRREKKIADKRHSLYHLETKPTQDIVNIEKKESITTEYKLSTAVKRPMTSYAYVINDIRKALLASIAIILIQLVLYFYLFKL